MIRSYTYCLIGHYLATQIMFHKKYLHTYIHDWCDSSAKQTVTLPLIQFTLSESVPLIQWINTVCTMLNIHKCALCRQALCEKVTVAYVLVYIMHTFCSRKDIHMYMNNTGDKVCIYIQHGMWSVYLHTYIHMLSILEQRLHHNSLVYIRTYITSEVGICYTIGTINTLLQCKWWITFLYKSISNPCIYILHITV